MSETTNNSKLAKAEVKAAKAKAKALRPWFKKKRFILPLAIVLIFGISQTTRGGNTPATESSSNSTSSDTPVSEEASTSNWFAENYPSFTGADFTGKGDDVQDLPVGATSGIIIATHKGGSNFVIEVIDDTNSMVDLSVNEIGNYAGTTAYGLTSFGGEAKKLKITADGTWAIQVVPFSDAPALPSSGKGDGVFKYESGDAPTWTINHKGKGNFSVAEYADSVILGLLVNEIGNYSGKVPAYGGPAIVVVTADGTWTIE